LTLSLLILPTGIFNDSNIFTLFTSDNSKKIYIIIIVFNIDEIKVFRCSAIKIPI
jgi:hypothetical protein